MSLLDRLVVRDERTKQAGPPSELARRAASVPDSELLMWIDNTLAHVGHYSRQFLSTSDEVAVQEAENATEALAALVSELRRRRATSP